MTPAFIFLKIHLHGKYGELPARGIFPPPFFSLYHEFVTVLWFISLHVINDFFPPWFPTVLRGGKHWNFYGDFSDQATTQKWGTLSTSVLVAFQGGNLFPLLKAGGRRTNPVPEKKGSWLFHPVLSFPFNSILLAIHQRIMSRRPGRWSIVNAALWRKQ